MGGAPRRSRGRERKGQIVFSKFAKRKEGYRLHLRTCCGLWKFDPQQVFDGNHWEGIPVRVGGEFKADPNYIPHEDFKSRLFSQLKSWRGFLESELVTPEGIAFVATTGVNGYVEYMAMWGYSVNEQPAIAINGMLDDEIPVAAQPAVG